MPLVRGTRYAPILGGGRRAFSPFSVTLFEAMEVQPDDARKAVIDTFIKALVKAGVWDKLDVLYVFAAHTEQAALLNWKNPGTFDATLTNEPTFTTDKGFTGNGTDTSISSGFNPTTANGNYSLDSACIFGRNLVTAAANNGFWATIGGVTVAYLNLSGLGRSRIRLNSADRLDVDVNSDVGFFAANRESSTTMRWYVNGTENTNYASGTGNPVASTAVPNTDLFFLRTEEFSAGQIASAGFGASLDATQHAALAAAELAYMQAVGAVE